MGQYTYILPPIKIHKEGLLSQEIGGDRNLGGEKLQDLIEEHKMVSKHLDGSDCLKRIPMNESRLRAFHRPVSHFLR